MMPLQLAKATTAAPIWPAIVAAAIGAAGVILGLVACVRAGRSAQLAERAERRAIDAESRAEEAHLILKERFADDRTRARAQLEAPGIAETFVAKIIYERGRDRSGMGDGATCLLCTLSCQAWSIVSH
jgi:hypothetical protein